MQERTNGGYGEQIGAVQKNMEQTRASKRSSQPIVNFKGTNTFFLSKVTYIVGPTRWLR